MSQSNGTFTHTIPDPESISDFRRLIRERNRAARLRHKLIESSEEINDLDVIIVDLEEERDALGADLDEALTALALLKLQYEMLASNAGISYQQSVELRGYSLSEVVLARHGKGMLAVLTGGDS